MTPVLRSLPAVTPGWRREADVVIVGSGAAGITAALTAAAQGLSVLMITKDLAGGASPLAQGGLAAAIGPGDTAEAHARDTMTAGAGFCDRETVSALAAGSPGAIAWLVARGARLELRDLRLEGGHSRRRIVHSGDDASGLEVHRALRAALLQSQIEVLDQATALDLVTSAEGRVAGVTVLGAGAARPGPGLISARAVILATGGLGQAFATTSNPASATGDAIAMAARAGAVLRDLEFVQFHPTVLWSDGAAGQRPLITEALRGAGAVLRDRDGAPVMAGRHPLGDLAPRDVVAAAMHERIEASGGGHLWLDATALDRGVLEDGFPTVTAACRDEGVDPVTDLIPVAPGAHYSCGGIAAGLDGRTSIPGLYAIGEAASTGVHGANRLASNSLVEAVIMGRGVVESVTVDQRRPVRGIPAVAAQWVMSGSGTDRFMVGAVLATGTVGVAAADRAGLAEAMSRHAGVVRDREGLLALLRFAVRTPGAAPSRLDLACVEATNLHAASVLIAAAALARTESRGCHRRRDAPQGWSQARHTLLHAPDGSRRAAEPAA
jgi:L-aspartate oxidase